jgi:hypothetical protein
MMVKSPQRDGDAPTLYRIGTLVTCYGDDVRVVPIIEEILTDNLVRETRLVNSKKPSPGRRALKTSRAFP